MNTIKQFLSDEQGVTALEYGLLAAVVCGALIAVAGPAIRDFFGAIFDELTALSQEAIA